MLLSFLGSINSNILAISCMTPANKDVDNLISMEEIHIPVKAMRKKAGISVLVAHKTQPWIAVGTSDGSLPSAV